MARHSSTCAKNEFRALLNARRSQKQTLPNSNRWILGLATFVVAFQILHLFLDPPTDRTRQTRKDDAYALSLRESLGFIADVPDTEWRLLKQKVFDTYPNVKGNLTRLLQQETGISASDFFQTHYEPDFSCRHERRLGALGDGGKWVCDPHRLPTHNCLIYSVGSSGDTSFEEALLKFSPQCEIHTFDMDPKYRPSVERVGAHFHAWGISDSSYTAKNGVFKTLHDTMRELGHVGRTVDVLKIDCEGCEWDVAPSFFQADFRQVLIELHSVKTAGRRHAPDYVMPMPKSVQFFDAMYKHGYVIFHKEVNIQYWHISQCIEYGFLKLHKDFFDGLFTIDESQ